MARNYRKDGGGMDIDPTPTPTPPPPPPPDPTKRRRTPTPTPTPWPPKMYGTPIPDWLSYIGFPMGNNEMGMGGSGGTYKRMSKGGKGIYSVPEVDRSRGYRPSRANQNSMPAYNPNKPYYTPNPNYNPSTINPNKPYYTPNPNYNPMGMGGGSKGTMKSMHKASKTQTSPYDDSPMYSNAKGSSRGPSRSDAYIPYVSEARSSKLTPEQRGRMMANTATSRYAKDKLNDTLRPIIMGALMASPLAPFLGLAAGGKILAESKTGKKVISAATDLYGTAAENAKHEIRGIQMLPKAVRQANQSVLDELNGRSIGDYAIDRADRGIKSRYNSAVDTGSKALASGWKQRKEEYKNTAGIGELIGAAEALGLDADKRKELMDSAGRIAGKAWAYNPTRMVARVAINQIPEDVRARGVAGNAKSAKNVISDFITNNGRKLMSEAGTMGRNALSSAGNSISNWFDKSATSSRGSRSMSKSLKSNKRNNKYF